jgi:hypothetical protein
MFHRSNKTPNHFSHMYLFLSLNKTHRSNSHSLSNPKSVHRSNSSLTHTANRSNSTHHCKYLFLSLIFNSYTSVSSKILHPLTQQNPKSQVFYLTLSQLVPIPKSQISSLCKTPNRKGLFFMGCFVLFFTCLDLRFKIMSLFFMGFSCF